MNKTTSWYLIPTSIIIYLTYSSFALYQKNPTRCFYDTTI